MDQPLKNNNENTGGQLQNLALNTNKAGMEGLDTEKINAIIKNASEGSNYYKHKIDHQEKLNSKIEAMKKTADGFSTHQIMKATQQMDILAEIFENSRDLTRTIVHVDMDMFYAAVEMRDNPALRDVPMAVGGSAMLCTSNYAARKFGVRAAMPGFIAKKLCPNLRIIPTNMAKYKEVSSHVQSVFQEYDPNFSPMSLDEAYLDLTDYIRRKSNLSDFDFDDDYNDAEKIVNEMRQKIFEKTGLTASAGIACNTRLAKVCSDLNKPNGQYYLPPDIDEIMKFVKELPIRKVSGIGNVSEQHLNGLGIKNCSDLWEKRGLLHLLFSETSYHSFLHIALGLGDTTLYSYTERDRKSMSTETTFTGTSDKSKLFDICNNLCEELFEDIKRKQIVGKVITLKYKTTQFVVKTRAHSVPDYTNDLNLIKKTINRLLQTEMDLQTENSPLCLRLLGVRISNLQDESSIKIKQKTLHDLFKESKPSTSNSDLPSTSDCRNTEKNNTSNDQNKRMKTNIDVSSTPQSYTCPVCDKIFVNIGLNIFNDHINECLEERKVISTESKDLGTITDLNDNSSSSMKKKYTCPVCSVTTFDCMIELDKHVDECLNFISNIHDLKKKDPISEVQISKAKKSSKSKKENTLMNYFFCKN